MSSLNWSHFHQHQAHLAELRREVEHERLARSVLANRPARPFFSAAMSALGRQLVRLGTQLQQQHGSPIAPLTPANSR